MFDANIPEKMLNKLNESKCLEENKNELKLSNNR